MTRQRQSEDRLTLGVSDSLGTESLKNYAAPGEGVPVFQNGCKVGFVVDGSVPEQPNGTTTCRIELYQAYVKVATDQWKLRPAEILDVVVTNERVPRRRIERK